MSILRTLLLVVTISLVGSSADISYGGWGSAVNQARHHHAAVTRIGN